MSKKRTPTTSSEIPSYSTSAEPLITTELQGSLLLALALVSVLSLLSFAYTSEDNTNWLGTIGYAIGKLWFAVLGLGTYPFCLFIGWVGWRLLFQKSVHHLAARACYVLLIVTGINLILCMTEETLPSFNQWLGETLLTQMWQQRRHFHLGGAPLFFLYHDLPYYNLLQLLNNLGVTILALALLGLGLLYLCNSHPRAALEEAVRLYHHCHQVIKARWHAVMSKTAPSTDNLTAHDNLEAAPLPIVRKEPSTAPTPLPPRDREIAAPPSLRDTTLPTKRRAQRMLTALALPPPEVPMPAPLEDGDVETLVLPTLPRHPLISDRGEYNLPPADLLTPGKPIDTLQLSEELRQQADILEETLLNFGIEAKVGNINCGPTITSFEVHPAVGVKVQKIKSLGNDIALNLEAKSIRIIAPIPGKAAVGIEIPNPMPQEVSFYELLTAYQNGNKRFHIPMLLGKAVNGDMVMNDIVKMPHLIIAGATGSGKSVCINTIVMSIILNTRPDEVKLLMVDPKKVELTPYSRLPHMLAPVITEPQGACMALHWLVKEMERRYELLKLLGLRNIDAFNNRTRDYAKEEALDREVPDRLHYIVGIIDELADLMMVSSNDIETAIARIAQMARAIGIHLILATQRPSREVITGLIKANFPARIAFKVASRVNSQIILDETGAESLLGNGDMLFLPPGTSQLLRAQGAYIRDEDINRVIQFTCEQAPPNYVIQSFDTMYDGGDDEGDDDDEPLINDSLFEQARDIVLGTGNASTSFLQRKLKIGYARAGSLMDQLEYHGVVGPQEGSRPRKILTKRKILVDESDSPLSDNDEDEE